jgi:NADPH2:quinone reductase
MANIKLCGVLLAYQPDAAVPMVKTAIGANFAPTSLGVRIQQQINDLVLAGTIRPVIGSVVAFEDIPAALQAMADRKTTGRVIATFG